MERVLVVEPQMRVEKSVAMDLRRGASQRKPEGAYSVPHADKVATTCVHDLALARLVCQKYKKAGKCPTATLLQLAPQRRHGPTKN